jgi:hypothetical protein
MAQLYEVRALAPAIFEFTTLRALSHCRTKNTTRLRVLWVFRWPRQPRASWSSPRCAARGEIELR